jgi:hypothetical protein
LALLRDVAARAVAIQEAIEAGDPGYAYEIARDLEHDAVVQVYRLEEAA